MSDLTDRLRRHIDQMAPHQRERESGRLLIEALRELERWRNLEGVRAEIRRLERKPAIVPSLTYLYQGGSDG